MAEVKTNEVTGREMAIAPDAGAWVDAAFDWWREAGVDCIFVDEPIDWLAREPATDEHRPAPPAPEPSARPTIDARARLVGSNDRPAIGGDPAQWPTDFADFERWWLDEPSLDIAPGASRVRPSGPAGAPLMILVPMPERGDSDALLEGPQGRLLDAMLRAMGLARSGIRLGSALPAHVSMPDWQGLAASGLGAVAMHHVALARPKRLLVLGKTDISSLITHDPAKKAAILPQVNQEGLSVPVALDYALGTLLAQPALKRRVWANWLEWTEAGLQ